MGVFQKGGEVLSKEVVGVPLEGRSGLGSLMGALKWGLKATLRNSRTIFYNCARIVGFVGPCPRGTFVTK